MKNSESKFHTAAQNSPAGGPRRRAGKQRKRSSQASCEGDRTLGRQTVSRSMIEQARISIDSIGGPLSREPRVRSQAAMRARAGEFFLPVETPASGILAAAIPSGPARRVLDESTVQDHPAETPAEPVAAGPSRLQMTMTALRQWFANLIPATGGLRISDE